MSSGDGVKGSFTGSSKSKSSFKTRLVTTVRTLRGQPLGLTAHTGLGQIIALPTVCYEMQQTPSANVTAV